MNAIAQRQELINGAAWATCDAFRGIIDADAYKDYVLTMLFLKYLTDTWNFQVESYRSQYADAEHGLVEELLASERFVLPTEGDFYALHAARFEPGNGERIDRALHALEEANIAKLDGVFQDISFNAGKLGESRQKNEILRQLLERFARPELDLAPRCAAEADLPGNACEFLIKQFASTSGKRAGDFYTPPEVSTLMAQLMDPREGDEILDPTCGSGSLLFQCARLIRERSGTRRYALHGQEAIGSTRALAKINLFLHGEDNHRIEWGDTVRNPRHKIDDARLKRFDIVVANPPFSLERWGREAAAHDSFGRFRRGMPPKTKGDYAFILHMVESMKPGCGRMAVVVPHGVLFRGGAEAGIRRRLVEENLIDTIIGLPEKLFYGTGIPATLIVMRTARRDSDILFIDASQDFEAGKNQNRLRDLDVDRIVATCAARTEVERYARLASVADIARNDFNLNISRYVHTAARRPAIDLAEVRRDRACLLREMTEVEEALAVHLRELGHDLGIH